MIKWPQLIFWALVVTIFLISICVCRNNPVPLSGDKTQFIGNWRTASGYELQIAEDGTARIIFNGRGAPNLNIPVAPGGNLDGFYVHFIGDSILEIARPSYYAKTFKIEAFPKDDSLGRLMVLNGTSLYKQ